ncbi:MAG: transglutaminase-like domain-containing protein [Porphyromonadaceae bacterium]|nr:transglutaminase-like domain-containing protein [Porphyromonadaceae bacterium]
MRKLFYLFCLLLLSFSQFSYGDEHFIHDEIYRNKVQQDFELKKKQLPNGDLFKVFRQRLSPYEREALMYLYAYMPIGDITDYSGEYYLENIRLSKRASEEMPWGSRIPEDVFRHFVLPIRVNNENLDDSRKVFFAELKERVKNMSLHDAVLEVNHWCHEKVIYTPSDARTSSPLASVRSAYGRCGEESTFTVAALRSVGIPARQVYTPRWAHTDDNHAWVEAWVDGKWYFFGACEPEPVLNLGWFNTAASRGMLMHSKVMGRYEGKEEIMLQTPTYTEINLIQNYAPTAKAYIQVTDQYGKPMENAKVEFKIYNYAEFYTVATRYTDKDGFTWLSAGKGDMLVWASKDGAFGYSKVSFGKDRQVKIGLYKKSGENCSVLLDIVPPPESPNIPEVTPEQRAENNRRLAHEDSIRNAYVSTFMDKVKADDFVKQNGLPERAAAFLVASRGNWKTLTEYLLDAKKKNEITKALDLLSVISDKDLRDVSLEVLYDHLYNTPQEIDDLLLFNTCIMNPRVGNEMILPYKRFFKMAISVVDQKAFKEEPQKLVEWCKKNITINNSLNNQNIIISPVGVWKARVADNKSRNIFFVAVARSLGIPAWIDEVTGKIQYKKVIGKQVNDPVLDVDFENSMALIPATGTLNLKYSPSSGVANPKYYTHFTLSKFHDGTFHLLNYEEGDVDMGSGTSWERQFKNGVKLDTGYYMLVSGLRQSDGSVLSQVTFFTIEEGKKADVDLIISEKNESQIEVIGQLNSGLSFLSLNNNNSETIRDHCGYCGDGYYVLAILGPGQEPTNHALRDIAALSADFEHWGQRIILLFKDKEQSKKYRASDFPGLPSTISYGIDENGLIQKELVKSLKLQNGTLLPIFIIANTNNEIVFMSQGYTIGLGEQLMNKIKLLK